MYSAFQIFLEIFTISKLRLRFPSSEWRREDWTSVSGQTHQSSTKVLSTHSWRCQRTISFPRRYQIRSSTTCYSQGWIKCFWMSTFLTHSRLLCISMLSKWRQAYVSHHFFRFKESLEVFLSTHILNISALWIYAPYITFSLYLAFIHLCKREKEAAQCNAFDIYCCSRRYTANFWSVNREKKHLGNVKSYLWKKKTSTEPNMKLIIHLFGQDWDKKG